MLSQLSCEDLQQVRGSRTGLDVATSHQGDHGNST